MLPLGSSQSFYYPYQVEDDYRSGRNPQEGAESRVERKPDAKSEVEDYDGEYTNSRTCTARF